METNIEQLIASQIQNTIEKCDNPYILSTDLAQLNNSIAGMTNALANYIMAKKREVVEDESN